MKILLIGGSGTLGKRIAARLKDEHTIVTCGRTSGDVQADITVKESIENLFKQVPGIDACVCVAASGAMDNFTSLTEDELKQNMQGKLFGQINLVLIGQHYLNPHGSFTLTSGIFADEPAKGVTGGGLISGALHSFTLSAALELNNRFRVNCISPGMAADSAEAYGHLFPHLQPVSMSRLADAYVHCVTGAGTGELIKIY